MVSNLSESSLNSSSNESLSIQNKNEEASFYLNKLKISCNVKINKNLNFQEVSFEFKFAVNIIINKFYLNNDIKGIFTYIFLL